MRSCGHLKYLGLTAAIVCAGLLCRWPALGLPWLVAKYAGSGLWGAMLYAGLRALHPRAAIPRTAATAALIAVGVEVSRLIHQPALDAFRLTLAGQLLLGRIFSPLNIVAYLAGVAAFALADRMAALKSSQADCRARGASGSAK